MINLKNGSIFVLWQFNSVCLNIHIFVITHKYAFMYSLINAGVHLLIAQSGLELLVLAYMPKKITQISLSQHPQRTQTAIFPFIPNTAIMKPILDVRRQTCLGSFEPDWQLLLQSPEARSKSTSHLFQMVKRRMKEGGRERKDL